MSVSTPNKRSITMCRALPAALAFAVTACTPTVRTRPTVNKLTYHGDAARSGWNSRESELTPTSVAGSRFGLLWSSAELDSFGRVPPRLFATPLYVDQVQIQSEAAPSRSESVVYAASTTGYVYAIRAAANGVNPPGAILWRTRLTEKPCTRGSFGIVSTPVIDLRLQRIYVSSCDDNLLWTVSALDIRNGHALAGWPVRLDAATINAPGINQNGANRFPDKLAHLQRAALNLSPDGSRLYVAFGGEPTSGWMIAVDTAHARVASAFSATTATDEGVGGMWAAGGPAVDRRGHVYMSTGSSVLNMLAGKGVSGVYPDSAGNWGQSIIELADDPVHGFRLAGSYTPFNYCQTGAHDMDIGSSSPVLIDLERRGSLTPRLLALGGGKQGNAYLLNREKMPGSTLKRQACGDDSQQDLSLLAPEAQPQFGHRGPLNIFGPYSEQFGMGDQAKSRTTLAHFRTAAGEEFLFLTGSSKAAADSGVSVAPGLARLRIVADAGKAAYLRIDSLHKELVFQNPGSPVISSDGDRNAIVWVLDTNKPRSAALYGDDAPKPVLYAVDASSMRLLWKSARDELHTSGKYNEPTVANGTVFVGTDRIQAFGLRPK